MEGPVYRPLLQLQLLECAHRANRSGIGLPTWPARARLDLVTDKVI